MDLVYREIARDAARASGAALAHLVLVGVRDQGAVALGGAADGPAMAELPARHAIQAALAAEAIPDRKSTRLNSSHSAKSRMPSSA